MGHRFGCCPNSDDHLAAQLLGDCNDAIGKGSVAQVWLDSSKNHQIVRLVGKPSDSKLVGRPLDGSQFGIIEDHQWPFLGEVEERVRIDGRNDGAAAFGDEMIQCICRHLGGIKPAT